MAERPENNPCEGCHDLPICPDIGEPSECPKWADERSHRRLVDFWRIVMGKSPIYTHGPAFEEAPS